MKSSPATFALRFDTFRNLVPVMVVAEFMRLPGRLRLLELDIWTARFILTSISAQHVCPISLALAGRLKAILFLGAKSERRCKSLRVGCSNNTQYVQKLQDFPKDVSDYEMIQKNSCRL